MKVIHTSDWHLGARLHEQDRAEEHDRFLAWLRDLIRRERPDVLLVAGDVFDLAQPGPAAQARYFSFLGDVVGDGVCRQVVVTAGNHDSASLLAASGPLAKAVRVSVVGQAQSDPASEVVPIRDASGRVLGAVAAVPFMNEGKLSNLARAEGDAPEDFAARVALGFRIHYAAVLRAARAAAEGGPVVAMGHCWAHGAKASDDRSEACRVVGGLDERGLEAFAGADYVALGHLHLPQEVASGVWYSGAPLAMSFDEAAHTKGALVVELEAGAPPQIRLEPFAPPVALRLIAGTAPAILQTLKAFAKDLREPAYVALRVTEGEDDLATFRQDAQRLCEGTPARLLLWEDRRPRRTGCGIAAEEAAIELAMLSEFDVAERRLDDEHLRPEEREQYLAMIREAIATANREADHEDL